MAQLDLDLARSIASERAAHTWRDADHDRLRRTGAWDARSVTRPSRLSRAGRWLHLVDDRPAMR